eukprot:COSAG01_NODE_4794_length_4740_cov_1.812756_4_plen_58_part_00
MNINPQLTVRFLCLSECSAKRALLLLLLPLLPLLCRHAQPKGRQHVGRESWVHPITS